MIKVLFLAANPLDTNHLALDREWSAVNKIVRSSKFRSDFELASLGAVNIDDVFRELNYHDPVIVHMSSHGTRAGNLKIHGTGSLSQPIPAQDLAKVFHATRGNIRLLILNACYSRQAAELIVQDVDCVIGMNEAIHDEEAISFVEAFYDALASGRSLQNAFEQSVAKLAVTGTASEHIPSLLTRPGIDATQINFIEDAYRKEGQMPISAEQTATSAVITLAPFLPFLLHTKQSASQKLSEVMAENGGQAAWDKAQAVWQTFENNLQDDMEDIESSARTLAIRPTDEGRQIILAETLVPLLKEHPELARQVFEQVGGKQANQQILSNHGSLVERVRQRVKGSKAGITQIMNADNKSTIRDAEQLVE